MAQVRFLKLNGTYGISEEHDPTTDELALAGLTMNGNIDMQGNEVVGLPTTPSTGDAATSKTYVDNLVSGMTWRKPAAVLRIYSDADQGGTPPTAGSVGEAWVVNNWGGSYNDGDIVEWDGSQWNVIVSNSGGNPPADTRVVVHESPDASGSFDGHALDIATADGSGGWTFTDPQDGWALLINGENSYYENQSYVYDASGPEWVQFSGAGQINAGTGLSKSGNTLNVNLGDGITELPSDYVGIDLAASSGLELVGTSPNKQLQVQVDGAHGIIIGTSGLEIEIDDTPDTLDVDADGLKVVGLPLQFKINDVNTGATVTAANLTTLTDGSNADALHTHNITATDEAKRVEDTHENNVAINAGQVVRWSSVANQITPADNSSPANARAIGVARVGGAASPGTSEVVKHGICPGVLTGATPNTPYFLGSNGALVTASNVPRPGLFVRIGYAVNSTDLDVQIQTIGFAHTV